MVRTRLGLSVSLLALMSPTTDRATAAPVPAGPPIVSRWEPLLAWVPEDIETLIVSPLGFDIPKKVVGPKADDLSVAAALAALPTGPTFQLKDGLLAKELAGQKVLCVVEGSRHFTKPSEFGLMPYEGCHILQLDPDADEVLKKAVAACLKGADRTIELAETKVAIFSEGKDCDAWSFFVCRPRPGILICATNQDYLEETLKRIDKKPTTRAFPADLPEWKHVDVNARVWAIRHFQKEAAKQDPTSPLNPNGSDADAVGLVFWIGADPKSAAHVRYLSKSDKALQTATTSWDFETLKPKCKQGAGCAEITIPLPDEESMGKFFFVLMYHLGHGIIV